MSASASKVMSAKISASVQSGDSSSLLKTALMAGVAVLVVLLLIFLYKKFVAKKPHHEYFDSYETYESSDTPATPTEEELEKAHAMTTSNHDDASNHE